MSSVEVSYLQTVIDCVNALPWMITVQDNRLQVLLNYFNILQQYVDQVFLGLQYSHTQGSKDALNRV